MNRVIHGAVRRDFSRLDSALGAVRDGERQRAEELDRAYRHVLGELNRHHEGEDRHIFPMLAGFGVDPVLLGEMESEHEAMAAALADSESTLAA